jgi:hypothetical protein
VSRRRTVRVLAACFGIAGLTQLATSTPAAGDDPQEFIEGSGTARAQLARIAPRTGGLTYAVSSGVALAGYEGTVAKAQAQAIDLGLFGLLATTVGPCGGEPFLKPDQLPKPVRAHSVNGPPEARHAYLGQTGNGLGDEAAWAGPGTESRAESNAGVVEIPGVIRVTGGTTTAASRLVAGTAREATAGVSLGSVSLAGGAVELRDLRWEVTQHTGEAPVADGSFHLGQVLVAGQPVPGAPDLVSSVAQLNEVLGTAGLTLEPPAVVKSEDGQVEVTPLVFKAGGKTALSEPVGELLAGAQPLREAIGKAVEGDDPNDCSDPRSAGIGPLANAGMLLADITLAGVTATGGVDIELGGVKAMTEGVAYDSPFGQGRPLPAPVFRPAPPPAPRAPVEEYDETFVAAPTRPVAPIETQVAAAPVTPAPRQEAIAASPVTERRTESCSSTHAFHRRSCSDGSGMVVGLASLAVAAALFTGDAVLGRRRTALSGGQA